MGREILQGETPLWFIAMGIVALAAVGWLFWRMRASLGSSDPFPDDERRGSQDEPYMPFWAKLSGRRRR
ncbi:MAG TPA: hypothetical protein VHK06_01005 [Candidatus Limnocylindria bacterium]|nr:hypothetical protein [Candidatus Limnocylindria bacterium]